MEGSVRRKRLKPRLERRNAMKNIDYQVDDEVSFHNETSFRVKGIDGEFDLIFRSLGLSGPEDFAIPAAAWQQLQSQKDKGTRPLVSSSPNSPHPTNTNTSSYNPENDLVLMKRENQYSSNLSKDFGQNHQNRDGGIKGVRPPVLAPPPPMLRPLVVDQVTPTWDLMRSLAPKHDDDDDDLPAAGITPFHGESESEREGEGERERGLLSDSEDSGVGGESESESGSGMASAMVEEVDQSNHSVSPNGSLTRTFCSWQKGEILGKGSFGTVYEGFTHSVSPLHGLSET